MATVLLKEVCPGCKKPLGCSVGESSIHGSHDVGNLCMGCWEDEEELIEKVGTNAPELSKEIADLLEKYRS